MNADAEPESVEAWGDLALLGTLSDEVRVALRAAGFQDDPTAELAVASPSVLGSVAITHYSLWLAENFFSIKKAVAST